MNQILVGKNKHRPASGRPLLPESSPVPPPAPTAPVGPRKERKALKFVWLWIATPVIALLPATIGALMIFFPQRDDPSAEPAELTLVADAPSPTTVQQPPVVPAVQAVPAPIDPALHARLMEFAASLRADLPIGFNTATLAQSHRLVGIDVVGNRITFRHVADIDLRAGGIGYDPEPLLPDIVAWHCDGLCIEIQRSFYATACAGPAAGLIDAGAEAVYVFRDIGQLPIATVPVTAADCPSPAR